MRLIVGGSRIREIDAFGCDAHGDVVVCVRNLDIDPEVAAYLAPLRELNGRLQIIYAKRHANVVELPLVAALPTARYWQSPLAVEDLMVGESRAYLGSLAKGDFGPKSKMQTAVALNAHDLEGLNDARGYIRSVMSKARERDIASPMAATSTIAKQLGLKTPALLYRLATLGYLTGGSQNWELSDKGFSAGCEQITEGPWAPYFLWPDRVVSELLDQR